jgi:hypothetical protein
MNHRSCIAVLNPSSLYTIKPINQLTTHPSRYCQAICCFLNWANLTNSDGAVLMLSYVIVYFSWFSYSTVVSVVACHKIGNVTKQLTTKIDIIPVCFVRCQQIRWSKCKSSIVIVQVALSVSGWFINVVIAEQWCLSNFFTFKHHQIWSRVEEGAL